MEFKTTSIPTVKRTVNREPSPWTDLAEAIIKAMPDAAVTVPVSVIKETAPSLDLSTPAKFVEAVRRVVGDRATVRFTRDDEDAEDGGSFTLWGVSKIRKPRETAGETVDLTEAAEIVVSEPAEKPAPAKRGK